MCRKCSFYSFLYFTEMCTLGLILLISNLKIRIDIKNKKSHLHNNSLFLLYNVTLMGKTKKKCYRCDITKILILIVFSDNKVTHAYTETVYFIKYHLV